MRLVGWTVNSCLGYHCSHYQALPIHRVRRHRREPLCGLP